MRLQDDVRIRVIDERLQSPTDEVARVRGPDPNLDDGPGRVPHGFIGAIYPRREGRCDIEARLGRLGHTQFHVRANQDTIPEHAQGQARHGSTSSRATADTGPVEG
mgnify:CR=1 FL=1